MLSENIISQNRTGNRANTEKEKYILNMESFNVLCEDTHTQNYAFSMRSKKEKANRKKESGTMNMFVQITKSSFLFVRTITK
jgi:hypothetical protein